MRVLYVGKSDSLAAEVVNCFRKEDNDVYIMSESGFGPDIKPELKYKSYVIKGGYEDTEKYFINIKPELVIYAGEIYQEELWLPGEKTSLFLQKLLNVLNYAVMAEAGKFIFLSSSYVFSGSGERRTEEEKPDPSDYKGILYAQAEQMVRLRTERSEMEGIILRTDLLFGYRGSESTSCLTERIVRSFVQTGAFTAANGCVYAPVHVKDLANALLRLSGVTLSVFYHAAGSEEITQAKLAERINERLGNKYRVELENGETACHMLSAGRLKRELEWVAFHRIEDTLQETDFSLRPAEKKKKKKKSNMISAALGAAENFVVFLLFAAVSLWIEGNPFVGSPDVMAVYILVMALAFGMKQAVPSVLYTCVFRILTGYGGQSSSLMGVLTDVATLLQFTYYIFIGIAAGYTVDYYKLKVKDREIEYRFLEKEYETVQEINNDNLMIKQEYHKRLLNYKNSLPKLYSVISRLTVLEPERIFSEAIQAVKDIMEVETVAVYLAKPGSSYMRLIVSSEEKAVFGGKSWNLEEYPSIREAFEKDEVFIGSVRNSEEPAMAAPIYYQGILTAALVIKEVPFTYLSLNYTNLFRTLTVMIASSILKAKDYENMVRSELYLPETDIFYPAEFKRLLDIAEDKKRQEIADYCVLKMEGGESAVELYFKLANLFRNTDFFGVDDESNLYVLLGNTAEEELHYVIQRITKSGVEAQAVPPAELAELSFGRHG